MTLEDTKLERQMRAAESELFASTGLHVDEFSVRLPRTGLQVRVLAHGVGPVVLLLHGATECAAVWAPLLGELHGFRAVFVDLPGHGLSDPTTFRRGQVRAHAAQLLDDLLDALDLPGVPVIGHSLGAMFALWHVAAGSSRLAQVIAIGQPAVALPGVRVTMPLSLLTVRGVGVAVQRLPGSRRSYRALLARGLGGGDVAAAPAALIEVLRLSSRRPSNARSVASLMHAIDRFRRPRPESVLSETELAAIDAPTAFLLGRDDPYLSVERSRPSIERIAGARLHELDGGHAPWLLDPAGSAALISQHLRPPGPGHSRSASASSSRW